MSETENWMSPLNKIIWLKAFRKKQTKVTLRDGRKFIVKYGIKFTYPVSHETREWVYVTPDPTDRKSVNPFVPCGHFDYKTVTDLHWLQETGRAKVVREAGEKKDRSYSDKS